MHEGIDIAAPAGTRVRASGDGVVSFSGWAGGYGNYVCVTHSSRLSTAVSVGGDRTITYIATTTLSVPGAVVPRAAVTDSSGNRLYAETGPQRSIAPLGTLKLRVVGRVEEQQSAGGVRRKVAETGIRVGNRDTDPLIQVRRHHFAHLVPVTRGVGVRFELREQDDAGLRGRSGHDAPEQRQHCLKAIIR
jgi:hypothetical protein